MGGLGAELGPAWHGVSYRGARLRWKFEVLARRVMPKNVEVWTCRTCAPKQCLRYDWYAIEVPIWPCSKLEIWGKSGPRLTVSARECPGTGKLSWNRTYGRKRGRAF